MPFPCKLRWYFVEFCYLHRSCWNWLDQLLMSLFCCPITPACSANAYKSYGQNTNHSIYIYIYILNIKDKITVLTLAIFSCAYSIVHNYHLFVHSFCDKKEKKRFPYALHGNGIPTDHVSM